MNDVEVQIWHWISSGVTIIAILAGIPAFLSKIITERFLASHKGQLDKDLEKVKGEIARDQEALKWKFKKQELLLEKQVTAASAFFDLHKEIKPEYSHPDQDWEETAEELIHQFKSIANKLAAFRAVHGPFLSAEVRVPLDRSIELVTNHKFAYMDGLTKGAKKAAGDLLDELKIIEDQIVKELHL